MTFAEFLEWAVREEPKGVELIDGYVVYKHDYGETGMAGDRPVHNLVKSNARSALNAGLKGRNCLVYVDGIAVRVEASHTYIPDVVVDCAPDLTANDPVAVEPVIALEVLSKSTRDTDMSAKFVGYFSVASIQHYLIVDPSRRAIILHSRDGEAIRTRILKGGTVTLDPPGCPVDLDVFWEDIPA